MRVYTKEYYKDSKLSPEENEDIRRVKAEKRCKDQKTTGSRLLNPTGSNCWSWGSGVSELKCFTQDAEDLHAVFSN